MTPIPARPNYKHIVIAALITSTISALAVAGVQRIALNDRLKVVETRTESYATVPAKLDRLSEQMARLEERIAAIKEDNDRRYRGGN